MDYLPNVKYQKGGVRLLGTRAQTPNQSKKTREGVECPHQGQASFPALIQRLTTFLPHRPTLFVILREWKWTVLVFSFISFAFAHDFIPFRWWWVSGWLSLDIDSILMNGDSTGEELGSIAKSSRWVTCWRRWWQRLVIHRGKKEWVDAVKKNHLSWLPVPVDLITLKV